jgi:hypothetical protein
VNLRGGHPATPAAAEPDTVQPVRPNAKTPPRIVRTRPSLVDVCKSRVVKRHAWGEPELAMTEITAEIAFMRMLAKLDADIRVLEDKFDRLSADQLDREINTASALLSSLWDRLPLAEIDPLRVYGTFSSIEYRLTSIQQKAATRRDIPATLLERLVRAYNRIAAVVNLFFGPILPQLPNPSETTLLKITVVENNEKCDS